MMMKNGFSINGYFQEKKEWHFLVIVLVSNLIIKLIPATLLELGNDEVYYWTYALYPDWSHFDHPPFVGFTIQFFSLNLLFQSELFIRLGALVLSSANILLLYFLVKKLYGTKSATISVLMFTASFYFNIIAGLFILPDTPQLFFILIALGFGVPSIVKKEPNQKDSIKLILFGFFTGLGFLSKYHSLFLWLGFGIFIVLHNRIWFRKASLYLSALITILLMIPVLYWNVKNNFISFTFHGERVGIFQNPVDFVSFVRFNLGQFFYQNPVLSVIYILSVIAFFREKPYRKMPENVLMIYLALPLIFLFTLFSLFRNTFPHWTGPAYIGLLIFSSKWLGDKFQNSKRKIISGIFISNLLVFLVIILGVIQIKYGLFQFKSNETSVEKLGKNDFTLDMYGWKKSKILFEDFLKRQGTQPKDYENIKIVSNKWYPAAHLDYYIAQPLKIDLIVIGNLNNIHKYFWVNRVRGLDENDRFFFITTSQQYYNPNNYLGYFEKVVAMDTLVIKRNEIPVKNLFVFELTDLKVDKSKLLNPDF